MKRYHFKGIPIIKSMKKASLDEMVKGWFIGNFNPTVIHTNEFEVAVKEYFRGDYEVTHYHKVATEVTVIICGRARMNGIEYSKGDIIMIEPHESTDFEALEDTITAVIKYPGASNDKYIGSASS